MPWQDIVFLFGTIILSLNVLSMAKSPQKPPPWVSIINYLVLTTFGLVFLSLNLVLSGIATLWCGFFWGLIFFQTMEGR